MTNIILYCDIGFLLLFLFYFIHINKLLRHTIEKKNTEIEDLRIHIQQLSIENEQNKITISKNTEEKKPEINQKTHGTGPLRYKNTEGTIYYHGIGHLENKYVWWNQKKNRCIIEYKNKNKKIRYPYWETTDIHQFCTNCIPDENLNKTKRSKFYYICQGHKNDP